ncbi:hypothetical protein [Gordonia polyisoprenivorans]|uniref:hypothetical protein n=1 Tax=Gordonia polyisoprenivorans TaxID=84595 RepID=UPI001AD7D6B3|nr:hypothetical protein [Gordonia polyisoprenivorans]QTI68831.1 hypothetical protein J6U32_25800 [Gordonia polyisoprenivorans]
MTIELDRISIGRPSLRVALADDVPAEPSAIVVRRPTLRDAQRARSLLRAGTRDTANFSVALEVEVAIAPSAASARAAVAHIPDEINGGTVRYVGTPSGLVTLIRDIYAAEVADAVILVPLDGSATSHRVRELVLPSFAERRAA